MEVETFVLPLNKEEIFEFIFEKAKEYFLDIIE